MSNDQSALCCFGAGGHGKVVAGQWAARTGGSVVFADERLLVGSEVLGNRVAYSSLDAIAEPLLVTIGDNASRRKIQLDAVRQGRKLATFVADPANCYGEEIGAGAMVLAGAIVGCSSTIGAGVIVNNGGIVEHDCAVGEFTHISPNATILGECRIGNQCWIGAGAVVLPGIDIADQTVIGAGAVVTRSIREAGTYVGSPARLLQK